MDGRCQYRVIERTVENELAGLLVHEVKAEEFQRLHPTKLCSVPHALVGQQRILPDCTDCSRSLQQANGNLETSYVLKSPERRRRVDEHAQQRIDDSGAKVEVSRGP
jgi:hypothetical protein